MPPQAIGTDGGEQSRHGPIAHLHGDGCVDGTEGNERSQLPVSGSIARFPGVDPRGGVHFSRLPPEAIGTDGGEQSRHGPTTHLHGNGRVDGTKGSEQSQLPVSSSIARSPGVDQWDKIFLLAGAMANRLLPHRSQSEAGPMTSMTKRDVDRLVGGIVGGKQSRTGL